MYTYNRYSDSDRNYGPFTYGKSTYAPVAIYLESGCDEYSGSYLLITLFGFFLRIRTYGLLRPWRKWVDTSKYSWSKNTSSGYWDVHPNRYGFSSADGFFQLFLGPSTHDSGTTRSKSWFLPWKEFRHVANRYYGLQGELLKEFPDSGPSYEEECSFKESLPKVQFMVKDYDGTIVNVFTYIEEREWTLGTGYFKWLSWFRKPDIRRSLDLRFDQEVGKGKTSWKGGTVGHSIDMLEGELHTDAMKRYCEQEHRSREGYSKMEYLGQIGVDI